MGAIVRRADIIAKTEPLTEQTLLKEIFGIKEETFGLRKKKKYVLKQIKDIVSSIGPGTKQFVIYCLLRLIDDEIVYHYKFKEAWNMHKAKILIKYLMWYIENNIEEIQQNLVVV